MTPTEILDRLGHPVNRTEDGILCPVCGLKFDSENGFGPHLITHWKEADMSPGDDSVKHRCPDCPKVKLMRKTSMRSHLMETHSWDRDKAAAFTRVLGATRGYVAPRNKKAEAVAQPVKEPKLKKEPKPIDPSDAAWALVLAFANSHIPTEMVPDILAFVDSAKELAGRLRHE